MHAGAVQKLLQVCEQVKITCSQVQTVQGWKKLSQAKSVSNAHVLAVFTLWTTLTGVTTMYNGEPTILLPAYNKTSRFLGMLSKAFH
jgi:hypothetical protein